MLLLLGYLVVVSIHQHTHIYTFACVVYVHVHIDFVNKYKTRDTTVSISPEIFDYRVNNAPLQFVVASGNQTQCAYVQTITDGFERVGNFRLLLSSENSAVVVDSANSAATIRIFD